MNILKILFDKGIYNAPALQKMDERNQYNLEDRARHIEVYTGAYVNPEVLKVLAVRYFLDCYTAEDMVDILDYFDFINPATRKTDSTIWSKEDEVTTKEE